MHSDDIAELMRLPKQMVLRWLCRVLDVPFNGKGIRLSQVELLNLEIHLESYSEEDIKRQVYLVYEQFK